MSSTDRSVSFYQNYSVWIETRLTQTPIKILPLSHEETSASEGNLNDYESQNATYIQFDNMDIYPSITKVLLLNSINHASNFIDTTNEQLEIILNFR